MKPGDKPQPPRSPLGALLPVGMDCEALKRRGFREHQILVIDLADPRIKNSERHILKNLGRGYMAKVECCVELSIPAEADRILAIWGAYKRREGGAATLGYPRHSAGFASGGASTEDSFEEMVAAADRRTGAIADAILDEMSIHGHARQVMAIWNQYLGDVARFRGDPGEMLTDGCRVFLIEAKKRGIAV